MIHRGDGAIDKVKDTQNHSPMNTGHLPTSPEGEEVIIIGGSKGVFTCEEDVVFMAPSSFCNCVFLLSKSFTLISNLALCKFK